MPYHLKKPFKLNTSKNVYYASNKTWTETFADRTIYTTEAEINAMIANPNGKNGGFTGCTIVSE